MGFNSFLERLGFVRLRDFGLLLTADRRIVTTREVLDDGYGATVVGWEDSDLAATELKKRRATTSGGSNFAFRPLPPPPPPIPTKLGVVKQVTAMPVSVVPPAIPAPVAKSNVVSRPVGSNPFMSNTVAYPASNPIAPKSDSSQFAATEIAAAPTFVPSGDDDDFVKEDEWEWQIAMARVKADEPTPTPTPKIAAAPNPFAREPRRAAIHPTAIAVVAAAAGTPRTIIPVPSLPAAVDARRILEAYHPPALPRRMARGTRPVANEDDTSTSLRAIPARR